MQWAILWIMVGLAATWMVEQRGYRWGAAVTYHVFLLLLVGFVAGAHYLW